MTHFPRQGLFRALPGGAFVAANAIVTGDVTLGRDVGIWFGCVVRGDDAALTIGARTNIQDLTMIHADTGVPNVIGEEVTVGHGVILHGCTLGDRVLVGMGAIVLDLAVIETDVVLGAGSLVTPRSRLESGWLYLGRPAKKVRRLTDGDRAMIDEGWRAYAYLAERHR